jgi:hypothetical protein
MFRTLSIPEVLRSVEYRRLGTMIRRRRPVTGARPLFTCLMCACVAAVFILGLFIGMGLTVGFCVGLSVTACEVTLGVFLSIVALLSIPYFVAVVFCLCKGKSRRIGIASQQYDMENTGSNSCEVSNNPSQSDKDGLPSDNVVTDVQLLQPREPEFPASDFPLN